MVERDQVCTAESRSGWALVPECPDSIRMRQYNSCSNVFVVDCSFTSSCSVCFILTSSETQVPDGEEGKASLRLDLKRLEWGMCFPCLVSDSPTDHMNWVTKNRGAFPCTGCALVLVSQTELRAHRRDCPGFELVKAVSIISCLLSILGTNAPGRT